MENDQGRIGDTMIHHPDAAIHALNDIKAKMNAAQGEVVQGPKNLTMANKIRAALTSAKNAAMKTRPVKAAGIISRGVTSAIKESGMIR